MGGARDNPGDANHHRQLAVSRKKPIASSIGRSVMSRPSKRRRISSSTEDESLDDFIVDSDSDSIEGSPTTATSRTLLASDSDEETSEPVKRKKGGRSKPSAIVESSDEEAEEGEAANEKKKKSKYRIHIPREDVLPPVVVQYATQVPAVLEDPDSSPYRIRGAVWKFPKAQKSIPPPRGLINTASTSVKPNAKVTTGRSSLTLLPEPVSVHHQILPEDETLTSSHVSLPKEGVRSLPSIDYSHELADLPSDAFSSSPMTGDPPRRLSAPSVSEAPPPTQRREVSTQGAFRQTTLFGGHATVGHAPPSQVNKVRNYRVDRPPEVETHHKLDTEALKTWIYPTNLGAIREYQYSIVSNGLFNNTLVALPTGLGKTFIAATIMLNYFRWTKDAQIVFMAPTKPLVAQQIDACFNIVGIPRSATTLLTGEISPALRAEEWQQKRVFFMTPQTLENDLRTGYADPKKIVLLVVDEAHRATGNYAYVKVVKLLRTFSQSFRILALTATPGADVEAVQEVINGLEISEVEIRTEESIDIQQYVHQRNIEQIELEPSDEMIMIQELLSKALQPLVNKLCSQNAYYNKDPMSLTAFGLTKASRQWQADAGKRASMGLKGMMMGIFSILASFAHGIKLLNMHGIGPFYQTVKEFRSGVEEKGGKGGKYKKEINEDPNFKKLMDKIQMWINKDGFVGHPKLTYLCDTILNHFLDAGDGRLAQNAPFSATRVIVFSEFRDSAEEIVRVLNRHGPLIRASVFVGQANSKRSEGMSQKTQQATIDKFKAGTFNVLVATSIGEEGLDIGQVDLIVCYDASASPIRMLQRMGRTGRKRAGKIVLLLMKGKEKDAFAKAKDNYEKMQKMICDGSRFEFRHDLSTRIVPRDIKPTVEKRNIEIPFENTQDNSLPEPRRRPLKAKKRPAKKFHMPENAEQGFRKASRLVNDGMDLDSDADAHRESITAEASRIQSELSLEQLMPNPPLESVLLSLTDEKELERLYQSVQGDDLQEVSLPEMTSHPASQRSLRPTNLVRHGEYTQRCVAMLRNVHSMTETTTQHWEQLHDESEPLNAPELVSSSDEEMSQAARSEDGSLLRQNKISGRGQTRKQITAKSSNEQSDQFSDEDLDDDLEGFVIDDTEIIHDPDHDGLSQLSSSSSVKETPISKPFFEPTQFRGTQDTNDDDDMPDVEDLLRLKPNDSTRSPLMEMHGRGNNSTHTKPDGKRRRRIVQDDSDE